MIASLIGGKTLSIFKNAQRPACFTRGVVFGELCVT
jgi:hypothetical protein